MNLKQSNDPRELKQVLHSLIHVHQFHLPAILPDEAVTSHQLTHAVAIDEVHTRQVEQEFLMAVAGRDVNQVTELSAAVTQREPSHRVKHRDSVEFPRADLKTHGQFKTFY